MPAQEIGFRRIESLTEDQVENLLLAASENILYPKRFMRMGINGISRPSVYETCSMFKLPIRQHRAIMAHLPSWYADRSIVRYFLKFPAKTGFLDGQSYWMDKSRPMDIVAWSLTDNNQIRVSTPLDPSARQADKLVEGNIVVVDGVPHEVTKADKVLLKDKEITIAETRPKTHTFNKGEGFAMSLSRYHEIVKREEDHLWFCLGVIQGTVQ